MLILKALSFLARKSWVLKTNFNCCISSTEMRCAEFRECFEIDVKYCICKGNVSQRLSQLQVACSMLLVSLARRLRHGRCSICSVEYNSPRLRDATTDERVHRLCFLLFFTAKVSGFCTGGHLMRICGLTLDIANAKQRSFANTALCSLRRLGFPSPMSRPRPSCELAMQRPLQPAALPTNGTTKHLR